MTGDEYEECRNLTSSLKFLLAPRRGAVTKSLDLETAIEQAMQIGRRLRTTREMFGWTRNEVAERTGLTYPNIKGAERGNIHQQGASFETYVKYAGLLGVPLAALVADNVWDQWSATGFRIAVSVPNAFPSESAVTNERRLLDAIERIISEASARNEHVTQQRVCELIGKTRKHLMGFAGVRARLKALPSERKTRKRGDASLDERAATLMLTVRAAIEYLQGMNKPLTRIAIARWTGYSVAALYHYPQVRLLLDEVCPTTLDALNDRTDHKVDVLISLVIEAARAINSTGRAVTARAIYVEAGLSRAQVSYYPHLRSCVSDLVKEYCILKEKRREARQQQIANQVLSAKMALEAEGFSVTLTALSKRVGISISGLRYYPAVRRILEDIVMAGNRQ
jgi:transcriptional regulator with XRE-family HTH domain